MALVNTINASDAAGALATWWHKRHPEHTDVIVEDLEIPAASGMSSETILFSLRRAEDDGRNIIGHYAARVVAPGGQIFPEYDFHLERLAMDTVRATTKAPAPEVFAVEDDPSVLGAPFLLMEQLRGQTLSDDPPFTMAGWFTELTDPGRAAVFDNGLAALAEVHRADISAFPVTVLGHPRRAPGTATAQHVAYWEHFFQWSADGRVHPVIQPALRWLKDNLPADEPGVGICWGDARLGNMMFDEHHQVSAVLDWEMLALGPAEIDLGWFTFLNRMYTEGISAPLPGGFPDQQASLNRYSELAGRPIEDFTFYEVLAGVRLATVLMRIAHMLMEKKRMPPDNPMPLVNPATVVLANLLGLERADNETGWVTGHR